MDLEIYHMPPTTPTWETQLWALILCAFRRSIQMHTNALRGENSVLKSGKSSCQP